MQGCAETYVLDETESKSPSQSGSVCFRQGCMSLHEKQNKMMVQKENENQPSEKPNQECTRTAIQAQSAEPKCRQIGTPSRSAMSLSQRLRNLQIPAMAATESLDHLTLEVLSSEVVSFGQKYSGSTYADTWQDQEWVHFMINRYQNSQKEAHRRYLKFVELKIESLEQTQMIIPREPSAKSRPVSKAKAMAKHIATPSVISSLDGETEWDIEPETYGPVITESHVTSVGRRCPGDATKDVESGECIDQGDPSSREPELPGEQLPPGGEPVREDWDETVLTAMHHEASHMKQLVQQLSHEFDEVLKTTKPLGNAWDLAEVMCSEKSPLTQQMLQLGKKSVPFWISSGRPFPKFRPERAFPTDG